MGGRAAITAVVGLLSLAACGGGADDGAKTTALADVAAAGLPSTTPIAEWDGAAVAVGDCLSSGTLGDSADDLADAISVFGMPAYSAMSNDPRWDAVVDCGDNHGYEVYDVVTLPAELDEQITSYSDLLGGDRSLARQVQTAVTHECALAIEPAAIVMEAAPLQVDVLPVVNAASGLSFLTNPLPPQDWAAGRRGFACLLAHEPAGKEMAADVVSAVLPFADRVCLAGHDFVSCGEPHDAERIGVLAVDTAIDSGALRGKQAVDASGDVNLGDAQWALLDEVCDRYFREISMTPATGLVGVADTYPEVYPDASGSYRVICSAQSPFGTADHDAVITATSVFDQ